ncbi:MAG: hypothetical protein GX129_00445 [Clostridiales bacterium]|jgi:hypothetical protein|nr:hypothetical protein [Clostridiales bacterium]
MRKIKTNKKLQKKAPMKDSTKILLYSLAGLVLLFVVILLVIEGMSSKIIIKNNSDVKLEYVKAYFVDIEGPVSDDVKLFENLDRGDNSVLPLEKIDLAYRQANLEVRFKFEGHDELFVDAGYFNEIFSGRINIGFEDIDNERILLKVKASTGVIPSPHIDCDEEYVFNLATGEEEE